MALAGPRATASAPKPAAGAPEATTAPAQSTPSGAAVAKRAFGSSAKRYRLWTLVTFLVFAGVLTLGFTLGPAQTAVLPFGLLPIALAAGLFGVRIGLYSAVGTSLVVLPLALLTLPADDPIGRAGVATCVLAYLLTGAVVGGVVRREWRRAETDVRAEVDGLVDQIAAERQMLAAAATGMPEGLFIVDTLDQVVFVNPTVAQWLGRKPADWVNRPLDDLILASGLRPAPGVVLPENSEVDEDWEGILPGNPPRHVAVRSFVVKLPNGPGRGYLLRDITRERELDRLREGLTGMVAHDLREPLTGLVGLTELMMIPDTPEAQRREDLAVIHAEVARLATLLDDFLSLGRQGAIGAPVRPRPLDLGPVLTRRAALARVAMPTHKIDLVLPDKLPTVQADPDAIERVLVNLLSNAVKFSPRGSRVRLRAEPVGSAVRVSVTDQGLGIPKESAHQLFQLFYRVQSPDRAGIPGTGLGLAACRSLIEAQSGRIGVDIGPGGKGSMFHFTLPLAPVEATGPEAAEAEAVA